MLRRSSRFISILVALMLALAGCTDPPSVEDPPDMDLDAGTSEPRPELDAGSDPDPDAGVEPDSDAGRSDPPDPDAGPDPDPPPPTGTFTPANYVLEEALRRPLESFRFSHNYRTEMGGTDGSARSFPFLHDAVTGLPYTDGVRLEGNLYGTKALVYAAFAAYFDPAAAIGDLTALDYLERELTTLVSGGVEPTCRGGGHGGHTDGTLAIALAMVRRTPAVWSALDAETQTRLEFLMRSLTLAGNWSQNYESPNRNWPIVSRDASSWLKRWNPNLVEGYVGVMLAAYYFYGGAEPVNALLAPIRRGCTHGRGLAARAHQHRAGLGLRSQWSHPRDDGNADA